MFSKCGTYEFYFIYDVDVHERQIKNTLFAYFICVQLLWQNFQLKFRNIHQYT